MRRWLAVAAGVVVAMVVVTGCKYGAQAFVCANSDQCGPGGKCQIDNFCSFDDSTCPSGQRYGDISGDKSGQCVGSQPGMDAGAEAPPDMLACYGTGLLRICFASPPSGSRTISMSTPLDTTTSDLCVTPVSGGNNYCVIAAGTITVDLKLRATGAKPLVLLATDTITANALIDVGSHRGMTPEIGAGANPAACAAGTLPGTAGGTGGGGAGGSFLSLGGHGGSGGGGSGAAGGVPGAAVSNVTELRGGCDGQDGDGSQKGVKGHGGGAVFLIAGNKIDVKAGINAAGEGGAGGGGSTSGAGGAGAGGMIGFDAPLITSMGLLLATGGGGGEGSDEAVGAAGATGSDPTAITAAPGGANNTPRGGDGGIGSITSATAGGPGLPGDGTGATRGGGGGGGGGAGIIKAPTTASLGAMVAPAATP